MEARGVGARFLELMIGSIKDPRTTLRQVLDLDLSLSVVLQAAFLTAVVSVIMVEGTILLTPEQPEMQFLFPIPSIPVHLIIQFVGVIFFGAMTYVAARLSRGTGSFKDSLIAVVWLQVVILALQIVATFIGIILPLLGGLILLAAFVLLFYLLTKFIMEVHDFQSEILVFSSIIGTMFLFAFVLSFILVLFGFVPDVPLPPVEPS